MSESKHVLYAEDDEFIASVFRMSFEKAGLDVTYVSNGEEALESLKQTVPVLFFLDLMMPKKNGFEVLEEMSKHPEYASVHTVVFSNLGQDSDRAEVTRLGAKAYFVKTSVSIDDVVKYATDYLHSLSA